MIDTLRADRAQALDEVARLAARARRGARAAQRGGRRLGRSRDAARGARAHPQPRRPDDRADRQAQPLTRAPHDQAASSTSTSTASATPSAASSSRSTSASSPRTSTRRCALAAQRAHQRGPAARRRHRRAQRRRRALPRPANTAVEAGELTRARSIERSSTPSSRTPGRGRSISRRAQSGPGPVRDDRACVRVRSPSRPASSDVQTADVRTDRDRELRTATTRRSRTLDPDRGLLVWCPCFVVMVRSVA